MKAHKILDEKIKFSVHKIGKTNFIEANIRMRERVRRDEREFEVEQDDDQIAHLKILIKLSSGGIKLDTQ